MINNIVCLVFFLLSFGFSQVSEDYTKSLLRATDEMKNDIQDDDKIVFYSLGCGFSFLDSFYGGMFGVICSYLIVSNKDVIVPTKRIEILEEEKQSQLFIEYYISHYQNQKKKHLMNNAIKRSAYGWLSSVTVYTVLGIIYYANHGRNYDSIPTDS